MSDPTNPPAVAESKPGHGRTTIERADAARRRLAEIFRLKGIADQIETPAAVHALGAAVDRFVADIALASVLSQETPRAEPVAWRVKTDAGELFYFESRSAAQDFGHDHAVPAWPLYSAPSPADATSARLAEWRAARTAIFQHTLRMETRGKDSVFAADPDFAELWTRLGKAETALMKVKDNA